MADAETEKEWEESKRIEAERMKAARAIVNEKADKSSLAFLDPITVSKRYTSDDNAILKSAEKIGNRSIVLAISGAVLNIIGTTGGMVSMANKLGAAGALISGLPSIVGLLGMGLAIIMALVTIGSEVFYKVKKGRAFSAGMWSAVSAVAVIAVYHVIRLLLIMG